MRRSEYIPSMMPTVSFRGETPTHHNSSITGDDSYTFRFVYGISRPHPADNLQIGDMVTLDFGDSSLPFRVSHWQKTLVDNTVTMTLVLSANFALDR